MKTIRGRGLLAAGGALALAACAGAAHAGVWCYATSSDNTSVYYSGAMPTPDPRDADEEDIEEAFAQYVRRNHAPALGGVCYEAADAAADLNKYSSMSGRRVVHTGWTFGQPTARAREAPRPAPAAQARSDVAASPPARSPEPDRQRQLDTAARQRADALDGRIAAEIAARRSELAGKRAELKPKVDRTSERSCRTEPPRSGAQNSNWDSSREGAQKALESLIRQNCAYKGHSTSNLSCQQRQASHPVTQVARTVWQCSASFQCSQGREICTAPDGGASRQ